VILPAYNEVAVLDELVTQVTDACRRCTDSFELLFINDGSTDGTADKLDALAEAHDHVAVLHLSRNFGHQAALHAGLQRARGDAVIVMDSDLQDDPGAIPAFVERWKAGADVVYAVRASRKENPLKRLLFFGFYRLLNAMSTTPLPNDAGNFGLIDRAAAAAIGDLREGDRYFPGLRRWVGFKQEGVVVERGARYDGRPRVSTRGLFRLAATAVFSFSRVPLSVFYVIALLSGLAFMGLASFTLYHRVFTGLAISGWTSTIMTTTFFGTLNALGIAVLGEYVVRIYDEVRDRPSYVVAREVGRVAPPRGDSADGSDDRADA
jgi:glycosyltransferase involved in cell wall biosynthesis